MRCVLTLSVAYSFVIANPRYDGNQILITRSQAYRSTVVGQSHLNTANEMRHCSVVVLTTLASVSGLRRTPDRCRRQEGSTCLSMSTDRSLSRVIIASCPTLHTGADQTQRVRVRGVTHNTSLSTSQQSDHSQTACGPLYNITTQFNFCTIQPSVV